MVVEALTPAGSAPAGTRPTPVFQNAIPPFTFHPGLALAADPGLFERYQEIAFNAGRLDASMVLASEDYLRIARPRLVRLRQG